MWAFVQNNCKHSNYSSQVTFQEEDDVFSVQDKTKNYNISIKLRENQQPFPNANFVIIII